MMLAWSYDPVVFWPGALLVGACWLLAWCGSEKA